MFEPLPPITLKTGEPVEAGIVHGPDAAWADRVEPLLRHKGDPWVWQNCALLRDATGIAARFFVLHRGGRPFANIMLAGSAGVALLGHVWTEPADRGAGASSRLMDVLLDRFARGDGLAIYLGTAPGGEPFRFYARRGFAAVEPGSGCMVLTRGRPEEFAANWFAGSPGSVEPLDWRHWAAAAPLCLGDFPGRVRQAATGLVGRASCEGAFLPVLREQHRRRARGEPDCAAALTDAAGVVWGFASRLPDRSRPGRDVLDVYCHPQAWPRAAELLAAVAGDGRGCVAYVEEATPAKAQALRSLGLAPAETLPGWIREPAARGTAGDVTRWEAAA
ncbi:MAG: GNAT family N-acetyltransferase [Opitutaceae bacterium]|nr:GNAT family N-acetyltransferase [Opitutaceae bacterium]